MKRLVLLAMLCAFPAAAQTPQDYTLTLTGDEVAKIGVYLRQGKYDDVAALLAKIQAQICAQVESAGPSTKEPCPSH